MATGSVDGLVSGMDTTSVISQLMSLERQPQVRLEQKKLAHEAKVKAYQALNTRLASLQAASDTLGKADTWRAFKVSSSTTSVSATASTSALPGAHTFEVLALAKAHNLLSSTTYTSTAQRVTNDATITLTQDGETTDPINVGDGSLAAVVSGINAAGVGVKAAAVQVSPGQYKLSLTSTAPGTAGAFTVDGGALGATTVLTQGADAKIGMGDAVGGVYPVEITSSSNTFNDVLPGVTFTVSKLEAVTLDVSADASGISSKVNAMVTAANAVLEDIDRLTAFDATTKVKSVLTGDATARAIQQRLLGLVSTSLGGRSLAEVGIELTKEGKLEFEASKFRDAYAADPAGTEKLFRPGGSTTHPTLTDQPGSVSFSSAGDRLRGGSYDVVVTRASTQAAITLSGAIAGTETITIDVDGEDPLVVAAQPGDTPALLAQRINDAIAGAELPLVASVDGGQVVVRTAAYGSGGGFTMTSTGGTASAVSSVRRISGTIAGTESITITVPSLPPTVVAAQLGDTATTLAARINAAATADGLGLVAEVRNGLIVLSPTAVAGAASIELAVAGGSLVADATGLDVAGSIGGTAASSGSGQVLAAAGDDTTLWGLSLVVTANQAQVDAAGGGNGGLFGTFTYHPGLAQRLDSFADDAVRTGSGQLTSVIDGGNRYLESLRDQIASWDQRLEIREAALRRQFTTLETTLGNLRNKSSWLSSQLGGLAANSSSQ